MHGKFVWYELMTTDMKAAEAFYKDIVGWSARDAGMPGMNYTLLSAGDHQVAGLMTMPEGALDMQIPPAWLGYIAVDDVDESAAKLAPRAERSIARRRTFRISAASQS